MKGTTVLNRREFNRFCASASVCVMTADRAFGQSSNAAPSTARIVKLSDGRVVPAVRKKPQCAAASVLA
jgi:hypothetical protein